MAITNECGHHCGIQNGNEGHCWCPDCHGHSNPRKANIKCQYVNVGVPILARVDDVLDVIN